MDASSKILVELKGKRYRLFLVFGELGESSKPLGEKY